MDCKKNTPQDVNYIYSGDKDYALGHKKEK